MPSHYEVLGVAEDASAKDIKKAYKARARQYHPDKNPDDTAAEESFKAAAEAFETLGDATKRAQYDQRGTPGSGGGFGINLEDIFAGMGMSGFGRQSRGPRRGADAKAGFSLTLEQTITGGEHTASVVGNKTCEPCKGSGKGKNTKNVTCASCKGQGQMRHAQGFFHVTTTCQACLGSGKTTQNPCTPCSGTGTVYGQQDVKFPYPPGLVNGMNVRLGGRGSPGANGGPPGDLYMEVKVLTHDVWTVQEHDLHAEVVISMYEAALGCERAIRVAGGAEITVVFKPGTQPGDSMSIVGKGIPHLQSRARGNARVYARVQVPTDLSDADRATLEGLQNPPPEETLSDPTT